MGTNYYLLQNRCQCCKRSDERHVGKSSMGWVFALHVYPDEGINTMQDWEKLLTPDAVVKDEYGVERAASVMLVAIKDRGNDLSEEDRAKLRSHKVPEYAVAGPNGLLRSKLSNHCIGHGEGPWDYLVGEFF